MQDKYKAKVWDEDKQEWTEQEILVAHLVDDDYEKELKKQERKNKVKQVLKTIIKWLCVFLLILGIEIIMYIIGIPDSISTPVLYIIGILIGFNLE